MSWVVTLVFTPCNIMIPSTLNILGLFDDNNGLNRLKFTKEIVVFSRIGSPLLVVNVICGHDRYDITL